VNFCLRWAALLIDDALADLPGLLTRRSTREGRPPRPANMGERAGPAAVNGDRDPVLPTCVGGAPLGGAQPAHPVQPGGEVRIPRIRQHDGTLDRIISRSDLRSRLLPAVPERHRAIVATAAGAGLRWGEAAGLRLDAVDLGQGVVEVVRTVVEVSGNTSFKPFPKSAAGRREVPLPSWLVAIIREHLERWPTEENAPSSPTRWGRRCAGPCSVRGSGDRHSCGRGCWVRFEGRAPTPRPDRAPHTSSVTCEIDV
jgi:integrase